VKRLLLCLLAACGDNHSTPADAPPADGASVPATLAAGPVTIDTADLTLHFASFAAQPAFLQIGTAATIDDTRYYDPRGADGVTFAPPGAGAAMDGDWLVLADGTKLRLAACAQLANCAALDVDASARATAVQLQLRVPHPAGEPLYGTGDAAAGARVDGQVRELQIRVDTQSPSSLNETHVPVPLVLWPRSGAGVFAADDRPGAIDLAATDPATVTTTFDQPTRGAYRIYFYTATQPLDLVRDYVKLTALPAVPPRWAFAPQQWRNEWDSDDEMLGDAAAMRTRHIPGSVMWIDNPWETAYNTFDIDTTRFADAAGLIAQLGAQGYKVMFWSTPYVDAGGLTAADHVTGATNGYFVTDDSGLTVDVPWQNGPGAMIDFTAPGATEFWRDHIAKVTSLGAAGFKLDFGEELAPSLGDNVLPFFTHDGDAQVMHNRYAAGYHEAYLGALPAGDGFLITRAGAWGEQATNTAIWPGDLEGDFSTHDETHVGGLPSAISRGLSLSVSGYPFYGSDIGGFRGFPTTEVLLRWAEYASLGTIMQLGGGGDSHDPWDTTLFDADAAAIYQQYAQLHMQLVPYLWTLAQRAGADGSPATVPAAFAYDCACDDNEFLLGADLLVAPVVTAGATTRDVVLPPGVWFDHRTGLATVGDGTTSITVNAPLDALPLWYRSGSLVPMYTLAADTLLPIDPAMAPGVTTYADAAFGSDLRLVYTPDATATAATTLYDGTTASAQGGSLTITGGSEFSRFTIDVDHRGLGAPFAAAQSVFVDAMPLVPGDVTSCPEPGCWSDDGAHLQIRVFASAATRLVEVH
jgi:alpha-D-xyloside xylohydrolase